MRLTGHHLGWHEKSVTAWANDSGVLDGCVGRFDQGPVENLCR